MNLFPAGSLLPFLIFSLRWLPPADGMPRPRPQRLLRISPPTALAYCGVLGFVLLWNRVFEAIAVLASGPLVLLFSVMLQAPIE